MCGKLLVLLAYLPMVHLKERSLDYRIYEEEPPHLVVGNVVEGAGLDLKYSRQVVDSLEFSFLKMHDTDHSDFFVFDSDILKTRKRIDRDVICPSALVCKISLPVQVHPVQYFEIIQVTVEVLDRNDNSPAFPDDFVTLSLTEGSVPGFSLGIPSADDPDSPPFGVQTYHLDSRLDMFDLRTTTDADGTTDVELILMGRLDREVEDFLSVILVAVDGGMPPRSGSTLIRISVLDVNDHHPEFQHKSYNVSVLENLDPGTRIAQVKAVDQDTGKHGDILYGFDGKTSSKYGDMFRINITEGSIYVIGNLDCEKRKTYVLTVIARDSNPDSSAKTRVTVTVLDQNDNAPRITQHSKSEDGSVHISEYSINGTFVAHLTVVDPDEGSNGEFTCVLNDPGFSLHQLYATEFKLITAAMFDRELQSSYELQLICHDHGTSPKTSSLAINIQILDENDNSPVFSELAYVASVLENNRKDAVVIHVNANDKDDSENGHVQYHIDKYIEDMFGIDEETGVITVKASLDREQIRSVQFMVFAVDNGVSRLTSTTTVTVNILDENDESPEFLQQQYDFVVTENEAVGTEIGQVEAFDADLPPFNAFTFSLHPQRNANGTFAVDMHSGKLTTTRVLDREQQHQYSVTVRATSVGFITKSSMTSVTINVEDKNDNSPVITHPTVNNDTVYLSSSTPVGGRVIQMLAHDPDKGCNAKLSYNISRGDENKHFHMDSDTGVISISRTFHHSAAFSLVLTVSDCGVPVRLTEATLNVIVNESAVVLASATSVPRQNLTVVVVIACVTSVFVFVLVLAISALMKKRRVTLQKWCCGTLDGHSAGVVVSVERHGNPQKDKCGLAVDSVSKHTEFHGVYCGSPKDRSRDSVDLPRSSPSDSQVSGTLLLRLAGYKVSWFTVCVFSALNMLFASQETY